MAVTRAKKVEQVQELEQELKQVSSMIVATYSKLTVAQDYELRKTLRGAGAKYRVVKNTLAERAAKGTKVEGALKDWPASPRLPTPRAIRWLWPRCSAKYAKDNPEFTFKAGVVEGRVISIKEIESLATMPSKEEIYSKLLFLINAPAQRLVDGDECHRPRPGGGHQPGRGEEQVQRSMPCAESLPRGRRVSSATRKVWLSVAEGCAVWPVGVVWRGGRTGRTGNLADR